MLLILNYEDNEQRQRKLKKRVKSYRQDETIYHSKLQLCIGNYSVTTQYQLSIKLHNRYDKITVVFKGITKTIAYCAVFCIGKAAYHDRQNNQVFYKENQALFRRLSVE